jgi:cyclophilin family peptidyl-prolyl cis-trans isomerase/HEAT repeat protein
MSTYALWHARSRVGVVAVLVALVIGAAGCRAAMRGPSMPAGATTDITLTARLLSMTDQRQVDTTVIDAALASPDRALRARAALAIGQVKARTRFPRLRELLLDGDTAIAANAAFALGIGKDTLSVLALARAIGGAPDAVAREAAWSLGEIGEPARTALTTALGDRAAQPLATSPLAARAPMVRAAAVLALFKLRPVPVSALTPWLADSSSEVARAAAYVVGRVRVGGAIRPLLALRTSSDEEVRQHVARALTRATVGDSLADNARNALLVLVRDSSERVRVNAVRSLETFGPSVAKAVLPLLRDPAPNVRVATSEALPEVLARDTTAWRAAWESDTALVVRRTILQHVRRLQLPLFAGLESKWATSSDWQYRVAALGEGGTATGAPSRDTTLARSLLRDGDARVQRAARARLGIRDSSARRERNSPPVARPLGEYEALVRAWVVPGAPQPRAVIETDHGNVTLELFGRDAPLIVEAFVRLSRNGSYQNSIFHRVVPNFVVQDGDPTGDGSGDAGFALRESWTRQRHGRGCVGLATAGPDTGGSQYYLCHSPQPHLDGGYSVFGRVVDGFAVMDRIVQGDRMLRVRVP